MKTTRERRSSSGQAGRCSGGWTTCWTPLISSGPSAPTFSRPLTRRTSAPARLEQHRQPDPERGPVERLVERQAERADVVVVRGSLVEDEVARVALVAVEELVRRHVAEHRLEDLRARVQAAELPLHASRVGQVRLRDDEPVGDRGLLDRLLAAQPVLRVHGRDHALELEVVLDHGVGRAACRGSAPGRRARSSRRRRGRRRGSRRGRAARAGRAARRRGRREACSRRSRSRARPCARRPAAAGGGRSPTSPSSLTITAVSPISGWASSRESSVVLPLPRKPVSRMTRRLHDSAATSSGSSGSSGRPASRSASTQTAPRLSTTARPPLAVAQHPDPAAPVVEPEPVDGEHAVEQAPAEDPAAAAALLLGPVVVQKDAAEDAHRASVLPPS